MWSKLLNPGGGLRYHLRAQRRRLREWTPHLAEVRNWLQDWSSTWKHPPSETRILLLAPSGGYSLPTDWLCHLGGVVAADLDPLAEFFFRRTHRALPDKNLKWLSADLFHELPGILERNPDLPILFCNFLGQASECGGDRYPSWAERLPSLLEGRIWASFHDLYSGELQIRAGAPALRHTGRAPQQKLIEHFYSAGTRGELGEHDLPPLFGPNLEYRYWGWALTAERHHLIEACYSES